MEGFQNIVMRSMLNDLGSVGNKFTWFTTRDGGIKVKLNRALATQLWMDRFWCLKVTRLNKSTSDHTPIFIC